VVSTRGHRSRIDGGLPYLHRDQGLRYMKSIQLTADRERIGGLSGDAGSEVRVDPHFICGAKVEACTLELAGEDHLAR
jgi:hypothetical protein